MNEQYVGQITVKHRLWQVYATIEEGSKVTFVRLTYWYGERQFRLGEENDAVTKAAATLVQQNLHQGLEDGIIIDDTDLH